MAEHGWTTIRLRKVGSQWIATQRDVDVEGTGETAQWAAAEYCRKVAEQVDRPDETA